MGGQGKAALPRRQAGSDRGSPPLDAGFSAARRRPSSDGQAGRDGGRPGTTPPEPSRATFVATTGRLWLRRRRAALGTLFQRGWAISLAVLAIVSLVASGLTIALSRHSSAAPAGHQQAAHAGITSGPTGQNSMAATPGHAVAIWVVRQVSRNAIVACDPGMCRLLQTEGFPAAALMVLGPQDTGLHFCDVVVATQAVRNLIGNRLQRQDAPTILASFGSGPARIDVRAVAPSGVAAYRTALAADRAARQRASAQLVKAPRIRAAHAARRELLAGKVDSRLLITLAALAVSYPVNVVAFGDSAPGASAGVPLREVEVSGPGNPARQSAELQRIRTFVLAQHGVFLPAQVSFVRLDDGNRALRILFSAPSPLGLLIGRPVTQ
jgi:hypothetical protein